MLKAVFKTAIILVIAVGLYDSVSAYPFDGYALTGIRRLERLRLIIAGKLKGTMPVKGAQMPLAAIKLNLMNVKGDSLDALPPPNLELQKKIDALFPNRDESYSLALLDITPGKPIRFTKRQEGSQLSPGSVGKLAIAAGLFTELKKLYPETREKRQQLLRNRIIVADKWILKDDHEVPVYDPGAGNYTFRAVRQGDSFSLYEWVDHMLSASANSAASIVWKEIMLMHAFGDSYPPTLEQEKEFFEKTAKSQLREIALATVNEPLRAVGIKQHDWQLGSFFTSMGKRTVPGDRSYATSIGLLQFLVALERGKLVDQWSSLEIKRLMYMTMRRIRYASAPRLEDAAVYFKSGSLYRCKPEPNFKCGKYMGNVENVLNSVAIVEHPGGSTYLVALMSNVLRKNSAVEHQSLATFIDRIVLQP